MGGSDAGGAGVEGPAFLNPGPKVGAGPEGRSSVGVGACGVGPRSLRRFLCRLLRRGWGGEAPGVADLRCRRWRRQRKREVAAVPWGREGAEPRGGFGGAEL